MLPSVAYFCIVLLSSEDATAIYIDANTRIQILETTAHLAKADKEQCGAFIVSFSVP